MCKSKKETRHSRTKRARLTRFDNRDYSLLNKSADILKEEYDVPAEWWVPPNKDMVQDQAGAKWLPRSKRPHDIPSPQNPDYN